MNYPDAEWISDYEHWLSLCKAGKSPVEIKAATSNEFLRKYEDEYVYRYARFFEALRYLDANLERFDFGKAGVSDGKHALMSGAVLLGLRDYFCALPNAAILDPPNHEEILRLVQVRL
jgi:hypothetical protein